MDTDSTPRAVPGLANGMLPWALGTYCLLVGAITLVAPHLRAFPSASLGPQWFALDGLSFLAAGFALIGAWTARRKRSAIALYLFAGAVLSLRALEAYREFGFYAWSLNLLILGVGTTLVPLLPPAARRWRVARLAAASDWFSVLVAAYLMGHGAIIFRVPPGIEEGLAPVRRYFAWYSAAFLIAGSWLAAAELRPAPSRRFYGGAHVFAGAVMFAYIAPLLARQPWVGLAFWGGLGLAVAVAPWLRPLLARADPASLRARLTLALAALGAIPLIFMAVLLTFRLEAGAVDQAFRLQESIAMAISHDVEDFVSLHQAAVLQLAAEPGLLHLPQARQQDMLDRANLAFPQLAVISLCDAAGRNLAKSRGVPLRPIAGLPIYVETRRTNRPQVVVQKGTVLKGTYVSFSAPIRGRDGEFGGTVTAGFETARMANLMARTAGRIGGETYVLDSEGRFVAHPDASRVLSNARISEFLPASGSISYRGLTGERLVSTAQIPRFGWIVVVDRPDAIALAGLRTQRNLTLAGLLTGVLAAGMLGFAMAGRFARPLYSLAHATARLADGDTSAPIVAGGVAEIEQLRLAFEKMRGRLADQTGQRNRAKAELQQLNLDLEDRVRNRTAELAAANLRLTAEIVERRQAEEELRRQALLVNLSHDAIIVMDSNRRIRAWNAGAAEMYGWAEAEALGKVIHDLLETGSAISNAEVDRFLARDGRWDGELVHTMRDGRKISVDSRHVLVRGAASIPIGILEINRDVTGRKRAEEALRRLNATLEQRVHDRTAQLEASNKELEAFAYSVSHDLRAPLRGIDGWSLALQEDYGAQLDERASQYLDRVRSEAQRMGRLIDDLLQLSRITRAEMKHDPVDLTGLGEAIAGRLREAHPARNLEFIVKTRLSAPGDGRLLESAVFNLLENAVKFTSPRALARIEFGDASLDGERVFFVRDNGVGFDMALAGSLFGAFQRMHKTSDFPGMGIGLATVQRIIRRHGGRVWAESEVDRGATFYFTIPESR